MDTCSYPLLKNKKNSPGILEILDLADYKPEPDLKPVNDISLDIDFSEEKINNINEYENISLDNRVSCFGKHTTTLNDFKEVEELKLTSQDKIYQKPNLGLTVVMRVTANPEEQAKKFVKRTLTNASEANARQVFFQVICLKLISCFYPDLVAEVDFCQDEKNVYLFCERVEQNYAAISDKGFDLTVPHASAGNIRGFGNLVPMLVALGITNANASFFTLCRDSRSYYLKFGGNASLIQASNQSSALINAEFCNHFPVLVNGAFEFENLPGLFYRGEPINGHLSARLRTSDVFCREFYHAMLRIVTCPPEWIASFLSAFGVNPAWKQAFFDNFFQNISRLIAAAPYVVRARGQVLISDEASNKGEPKYSFLQYITSPSAIENLNEMRQAYKNFNPIHQTDLLKNLNNLFDTECSLAQKSMWAAYDKISKSVVQVNRDIQAAEQLAKMPKQQTMLRSQSLNEVNKPASLEDIFDPHRRNSEDLALNTLVPLDNKPKPAADRKSESKAIFKEKTANPKSLSEGFATAANTGNPAGLFPPVSSTSSPSAQPPSRLPRQGFADNNKDKKDEGGCTC